MATNNSNYINYFNTIEYITAVLDKERTMSAKHDVAKRKAKAGLVHYQWPMGRSTTYKPRTRTILAVRGATVDGVYVGDIYIKEGNM